MSGSTSPSEASHSIDTWLRMEDIISAFENALQRGERPDIEAFLLGNADKRLPLLCELVHIDLEYRLKAGEAARVEDYINQIPRTCRPA